MLHLSFYLHWRTETTLPILFKHILPTHLLNRPVSEHLLQVEIIQPNIQYAAQYPSKLVPEK